MESSWLMVTASSTNQEILEFVYDFIMTQGKRCIDEYGTCMYKKGNLRCAVGCILSDDDCEMLSSKNSALYVKHLKPEVHYTHDYSTLVCRRLQQLGYNYDQIKLLADLQVAHDSIRDPTHFRRDFRVNVIKIASDYGLSVTKLKSIKHYERLVSSV